MPSGERTYFEEFDHLRAMAILMVIFSHLATPPFGILARWVSPPFREMWTGVDLFFGISGFVVFLSMRRTSTTQFYQRRFWRIAPLAFLWAVIPTLAVLCLGGFSEMTSSEQVWHDFLAVLTLRENYALAYATKGSLLLSPYWSLCVEEHFYILLPIVMMLAPRRMQRTWIAVAIIFLSPLALRPLIYEWTQPPHPIPYFRSCTHCHLDGLLCGVLIADYLPRFSLSRAGGNLISIVLLITLALSPAFMTINLTTLNWGFTLTSALSAALVALAAQNSGHVLDFPLLREGLQAIGRHSYALYLTHVPVYYLTVFLFGANRWALTGGETAFLTLCYLVQLGALSFACHRWIELPLIRFGKARWARVTSN